MLVKESNVETRCSWANDVPTSYVEYHDYEWGVAIRDDQALYERVCLEGFQAGLSWWTILSRRADFRELFANFDPQIVATFADAEIASLRLDSRIIRHEGKIRAAIGNARATLDLGAGGLTRLIWSHEPVPRDRPLSGREIPAQTPESLALARALKGAGFSFIGPTSAYALMQACGLVNDHTQGCLAGDRFTP
jgi:DNA-3-methyladenine glycosylase I